MNEDDLRSDLSTYIDAAFVEAAGGTITAPVSGLPREEIGARKEMKRVLYIQGYDKGLPLNKTNLRYITDKLGSSAAQVKGKLVELFLVETTNPTGKRVSGVRVRLPSAV